MVVNVCMSLSLSVCLSLSLLGGPPPGSRHWDFIWREVVPKKEPRRGGQQKSRPRITNNHRLWQRQVNSLTPIVAYMQPLFFKVFVIL